MVHTFSGVLRNWSKAKSNEIDFCNQATRWHCWWYKITQAHIKGKKNSDKIFSWKFG